MKITFLVRLWRIMESQYVVYRQIKDGKSKEIDIPDSRRGRFIVTKMQRDDHLKPFLEIVQLFNAGSC